jgi:hypothetical protein
VFAAEAPAGGALLLENAPMTLVQIKSEFSEVSALVYLL